MFDFYASDIGTRNIVHRSKHYWQNEKANCCVVVPDACTTDDAVAHDRSVLLVFVQIKPGEEVQCINIHDPEKAEFSVDNLLIECRSFRRQNGKIIRPDDCGKILTAIFDLIDNRSWSFPRNVGIPTPYISAEQASLLERDFIKQIYDTVPSTGACLAIDRIITIDCAGTMLAERMGITPDYTLQVSHYDMKTNTQIDDRIDINSHDDIDVAGKNVLVIDDLISSGRTAQAVISYLLAKSAKRIHFYALYRTVASQEVCLENNDQVEIHSHTPISNAYWTYGRGFDLGDDFTRQSPAIFGATKHWSWETNQDVENLIRFFDGIPRHTYDDI